MNKISGLILFVLSFYMGVISSITYLDFNKVTIVTKNPLSEERKEEVEQSLDIYNFGFEYVEHYI